MVWKNAETFLLEKNSNKSVNDKSNYESMDG